MHRTNLRLSPVPHTRPTEPAPLQGRSATQPWRSSGQRSLRHEHGRDDDLDAVVERVWCIGQICPSACAQMHAAPEALADMVERKAVGMAARRQRWHTSQPAANRCS